MSKPRTSRILCLIAIAALVSPVSWGQYGKSTDSKTVGDTANDREAARATHEYSGTVKFSHPTEVNGATVKPGEYRMIAKGKELKIEDLNTHKRIAESPITWKEADHEFRNTATDIDKGVLTKINLAGTNQAVLLHRSRP